MPLGGEYEPSTWGWVRDQVETYERTGVARSVPIGELRTHLKAIPPDTEVVAYCRGAYCVYADDAVGELTRNGFRARRLIDGFPEWRRAGLPVATGT